MSRNGTLLSDVMSALPALHPRHLADTGVISIKQLRLICKEVCAVATVSAKLCVVHIRMGGTTPSPHQLAKLFAGARLQQLMVIITVSSDFDRFTMAQQLEYSLHEMRCVVTELGPAISSVTALILRVIHHQSKDQAGAQSESKRLGLEQHQFSMQRQREWRVHQLEPAFMQYEQRYNAERLKNSQQFAGHQIPDPQLASLILQLDIQLFQTRKQQEAEHMETWHKMWRQKLPEKPLPDVAKVLHDITHGTSLRAKWSNKKQVLMEHLPQKQRQLLTEEHRQTTQWNDQAHKDQWMQSWVKVPDWEEVYVRHIRYEALDFKRRMLLWQQAAFYSMPIAKPIENYIPWPIQQTCPSSLGEISGAAFAMLAAVVPQLRKLILNGCCWDAAIDTFGVVCPYLTLLMVEAPNVPIQALQNLGQRLPNLTKIIVSNAKATVADEPQLSAYMIAFSLAVQDCKKLTTLVIDFPECILLQDYNKPSPHQEEQQQQQPKSGAWDLIPSSLQELFCNCCVEGDNFEALLSRVPKLHLQKLPFDLEEVEDLVVLLRKCPILQSVHISDLADVWLHCPNSILGPSELSSFKERLLDPTFFLGCHAMSLHGECEDVRGMLAWLPPFPTVKRLRLTFDGNTHTDCLSGIARVFPSVEWLSVLDEIDEDQEGSIMDLVSFTSPLSACHSLQVLNVCGTVEVVTSGLALLLSSLARLEYFSFCFCDGVDVHEVGSGLAARGRAITIAHDDSYAFEYI